MQYIEEIAGVLIATMTALGAVAAAAIRIKKSIDAVFKETDNNDKLAFNSEECREIVKDLSELKVAMERIKADMEGKIPVQIEHLQNDVATLFDKTDKLTDLLIVHFSRQD